MLCILQNTFIHIPGIGQETEKSIWKNDILNWEEFMSNYETLQLNRKEHIYHNLKLSQEAFEKKDHEFFAKNIPGNQQWRLYPHFKPCFLDIETTGLDKFRNHITTIAIYDGENTKTYVQGINLEEFKEDIQKYPLIITFNGRCFDIPFIEAQMNIKMNQPHIDLRWSLKELGYQGGLKRIERVLGISREAEIGDVSGLEAVRLWYRYKAGNMQALETLLKYNEADVVNLKALMDLTYSKLKQKNFLEHI